MGTWGAGLYSSDDALDLRSSIAAVCRLPHDGDRLVELLSNLNPESRDATSEGHPTFWLVVADQFHKRGIRSVAQERALAIIADGSDLAMLAKLGMNDAGLRQRKRLLAELARELRSRPPEKPRNVMKKPQQLLFKSGDVLAFRIDDRGDCYNPYEPAPATAGFEPIGWDGCLILSCGLALEYFAWYEVGTTKAPWKKRPTLKQVIDRLDPERPTRAGTMSKSHVARMGLELLGNTPLQGVEPPPQEYLIGTTAQDISVANVLSRFASPGKVKFE